MTVMTDHNDPGCPHCGKPWVELTRPPCPRCRLPFDTTADGDRLQCNSRTARDEDAEDLWVCIACGQHEALLDKLGVPLPDASRWPVRASQIPHDMHVSGWGHPDETKIVASLTRAGVELVSGSPMSEALRAR